MRKQIPLADKIVADSKLLTLEEMPISQKPLLTVVEAAKYFQIGETNIRRITRQYCDSDFIYWKDNTRVYIRRAAFEKFLDRQNSI